MKGQEEMTKTYIFLAVMLIMLTFAMKPLYQTLDASTENNARLQAQRITGIINLMKAGPDNMEYSLALSKTCRIIIDPEGRFVTYMVDPLKKGSNSASIIENYVTVNKADITCNGKTLKLTKTGATITVERV